MRCPKCGHQEDKVTDSRSSRDGAAVRRRRMCLQCGNRFTTYEEVLRERVMVVKRDGRHEELSREKLMSGLLRACEKRPIGLADIEGMVDAILDELENEFEREIPSQVLGRKVMERLQELDEVAYVRFASVYRRFKDVSEFLSEVQGLGRKP